jgi:hypothetical protein
MLRLTTTEGRLNDAFFADLYRRSRSTIPLNFPLSYHQLSLTSCFALDSPAVTTKSFKGPYFKKKTFCEFLVRPLCSNYNIRRLTTPLVPRRTLTGFGKIGTKIVVTLSCCKEGKNKK